MNASYWLNEVKAAKKREKDFRKDGERILDICEGEKKDTPFNILFSNTETLHPALYSATPRPVVKRRFKDNDQIGLAAAKAGERVLSFLLDTNIDGYETFDEAMGAATYHALLPGRGVTCVKYDSEEGILPGDKPTPYKKSELVCIESKRWNKVYFGFATKWSDIPWICYEFEVEKEEAVRLVGPVANKLVYSAPEKSEESGKKDNEDVGERKTTTIYQIWNKDKRELVYVSPNYRDEILKTDEDPLELTGFFNCPRPIQFIERADNLIPVAPYKLYENQAKELNNLTRRIVKITAAIKARAVYDGSLGETLATLMDADDATMTPTDKAASLAAEGGMDSAIWFWPVDKLIVVLRELYAAREACKQVIFEIMGLADIMRGASQASETLGAQQIKQTWGSLKLKRKQKEVQRYARDLLRMQLEIAAKKFSEDTWAKMTGLPYLTEQKVMELQSVISAAQVSGNQQAFQQAQQQLQMPKWADVLGTLRSDLQRSYRIDIETNSTVEPEAVEDQKNVADVMNALGQFLNGVAPLVQQQIMPFQAAQSMMLAVTRRFRFGDEIEDYIRQMKPPAPPEQAQQQAEKQKMDAEMAMKDKEHQQKMEAEGVKLKVEQLKATNEERRIQLEREDMEREAQLKAAEHQMKMEALVAKSQADRLIADSKMRVAETTAKAKESEAQSTVAVNNAKVQESSSTVSTLQKLVEMNQQLLQAISADEEYERDPQTQRIARKRKVLKKAA